jgi:taurine dioxygenase
MTLSTAAGLEVTPVTRAIGAEVRGVDLREPLGDEVFEALEAALLRHQVLFLRGQALSDEQHRAFAERFGPLTVHPTSRAKGTKDEIEFLEDHEKSPPKATRWHADLTWLPRPPKIGILSARVIPEAGGDTMWSSLTAAWRALSAPMQERVEGLVALHDAGEQFFHGAELAAGKEIADRLRATVSPSTEHPIVVRHPDTGEKLLYFSAATITRLVGLHPEESRMWLDFLWSLVDRPEHCVRWRWQVDDLAIWDERCTLHRGLPDHYPAHRLMRRCTVDPEVGPRA